MRLIPTSITAAPGLTYSAPIISGTPDRGDEHVGARAHAGKVARARVAHGHGRVALEQQERHRLADQVRPPDHDRLGSLERHLVGVEQLDHPERRARPQPGRALHEPAGADGVSPSTSLSGEISAVSSLPLRPAGTGSWSRIPLTSGSRVALLDHRRDLVLGRVGRQMLMVVGDPGLGACLALVGDVDRRGRIVADEDRRQARARGRCARAAPRRRGRPARGPARPLPCRR